METIRLSSGFSALEFRLAVRVAAEGTVAGHPTRVVTEDGHVLYDPEEGA